MQFAPTLWAPHAAQNQPGSGARRPSRKLAPSGPVLLLAGSLAAPAAAAGRVIHGGRNPTWAMSSSYSELLVFTTSTPDAALPPLPGASAWLRRPTCRFCTKLATSPSSEAEGSSASRSSRPAAKRHDLLTGGLSGIATTDHCALHRTDVWERASPARSTATEGAQVKSAAGCAVALCPKGNVLIGAVDKPPEPRAHR